MDSRELRHGECHRWDAALALCARCAFTMEDAERLVAGDFCHGGTLLSAAERRELTRRYPHG